jgi:ribonuclease H2 subunit B
MSSVSSDSDSAPRSFIILLYHPFSSSSFSSLSLSSSSRFISLPHPAHPDLTARYLCTGSELYELQTHSPALISRDSYSSWFVHREIFPSGLVYLATPFDPLFLAIPLLRKASLSNSSAPAHSSSSGYFLDLGHIFPPDSFPHSFLSVNSFLSQLALICDTKQGWDSLVYRLNEEKVGKWMRKKVIQTAQQLNEMTSFQPLNSGTSDSQMSINQASPEIVQQSIAFISEYISPKDFERLCELFSVSSDSVLMTAGKTKKSSANANHSAYLFTSAPPDESNHQFAIEQDGIINADVDFTKPFSASSAALAAKNELSKRKSEGKQEASSAKKLAKIDTKGMKSLSSFFGKK